MRVTLYRHDRIWLLETNLAIRKSTASINKRVDWHHRDLTIVRKLLVRQKTVVSNLESPLRSRNWFLGKLSNRASIEKNILKLPLCQRFFTKYVETPEEFQLRRCLAYVIYCFKNELPIRRWEVERVAGLDKKHVLPIAKKFLQGIEEISSEQEAIKSYQEWVKISRIW